MTIVNKKLNKIHVNFWAPHYPVLLLNKKYATIFLNKNLKKCQIAYLESKDKFVDKFQLWLPKVKKESNKLMKVLYTNGEGDIILAKLKNFCKKESISIKYVVPYMYDKNGLAKQR